MIIKPLEDNFNEFQSLEPVDKFVTERYELAKLEDDKTEEFFMSKAVVIKTTVVIENTIKELPDKAAQVIRLSIEGFLVFLTVS